jgi:hypothetical protein
MFPTPIHSESSLRLQRLHPPMTTTMSMSMFDNRHGLYTNHHFQLSAMQKWDKKQRDDELNGAGANCRSEQPPMPMHALNGSEPGLHSQ